MLHGCVCKQRKALYVYATYIFFSHVLLTCEEDGGGYYLKRSNFHGKLIFTNRNILHLARIYFRKLARSKYFAENKIAKMNTGLIYKAKSYLNKGSLLALYFSYIHSCISYANIVWGSTHRIYLRKINSHQKHTCFKINI